MPSPQSPLITWTASSRRLTRTPGGSKGRPIQSYSVFSQPAPMPNSNRPSVSTSMLAASLANSAGWRKSLSKTVQPTRSVVVASAAAVSAGPGENQRGVRWSPLSRTS